MRQACSESWWRASADRFEPALCDAYAHLFSQAIAYAREGLSAGDAGVALRARPQVRSHRGQAAPHLRALARDARAPSRGHQRAARGGEARFPHAELVFVGPQKNYELFAGRSAHPACRRGVPPRRTARAPRGLGRAHEISLRSRFALVLDPDSRLTQLGLLPVRRGSATTCSKAAATAPIPRARSRTSPPTGAQKTLGIAGAKPYVALGPACAARANHIAVSLGVGENPAKRLPDPFEEELLRMLAATGRPLCVDKGAGRRRGGTRRSRGGAVRRERHASGKGSFAGFASIIPSAALYVGYDSAGQHRGLGLRRAADQRFRRLPRAAHVRPLAAAARAT